MNCRKIPGAPGYLKEAHETSEPKASGGHVASQRSGGCDNNTRIRFAYADPPYPRCAKMHYKDDPSGIEAKEVNHGELIKRLMGFDAWALSTHSPALREILPMCPKESRVAAWVKPFAAFKRNVRVAYSWEPVIFFGARGKANKQQLTIHDWVSAMPPIFTKRNLDGTKGQKPMEFCMWLFAMMGLRDGDEIHDLFPGSGAVTMFWKGYLAQRQLFPAVAAHPATLTDAALWPHQRTPSRYSLDLFSQGSGSSCDSEI